jgi:hypothetical protein
VTLLGSLLQPLAGSIIQVEQLPKTTNGTHFILFQTRTILKLDIGIFMNSTKTIGLSPDVADLNAFLAAAGVCSSYPDL